MINKNQFKKLDRILSNLMPKVLIFLALLIYCLVGLLLLTVSFSRSSVFTEQFENFSQEKAQVILIAFIFLVFGYYIILFNKSTVRLKTAITIIIPIAFFYYLILPLLSIDSATYSVIARNFIWFNLNPYTNPIGNLVNPWIKQIGDIWGLHYPSPYGPVFLLITIPGVIYKNISLIGSIYMYKILILIAYFLNLRLLYLLVKPTQKKEAILLYGLNPAIMINILIDGHNEIFISLVLLIALYFYQKKTLN